MKILKGLFILLNMLAVALLLLSTLAGKIPPSQSEWVSLFSYGYFLLLLLNVTFALLWLLASSKWFLLSTAAIFLRFSFVPLFFQLGGNQELGRHLEDDEIIVMTYNVHNFMGRNFASAMDGNLSQMDSNARQFLDIVDSIQPLMMFLQEFVPVCHNTGVADSLKTRGYKYTMSASFNMDTYGTVIFSRQPLEAPIHIDSSECFAVDMLHNGDTLRLINLHLESYKLDEVDYQRFNATRHGAMAMDSLHGTIAKLRQASLVHEQEWKRIAPLIESSPYPCVMAGDFNDTPASYFYQNAKLHLLDSYKECGKGFGTTYHGNFPAFRIDYVMHSQVLQAHSYRRLKSDISDHFPIAVKLKVPAQ
ncbi:MAG: endonuclease/exonuclease/phosphatase family protein [Bacteroidales bacterium]|nr:endonuclease/exonuclease/phosphatase family protein [Bacteroidales bacterium]